MKRFIRILAVCSLMSLAMLKSAAGMTPAIRELKQPTFSRPAFALPGGSVSVELETTAEGRATAAAISPALEAGASMPVAIDAPLKAGSNSFEFKLPAQAAPGLYDLCVSFVAAGQDKQDCQRHAVSVVKSFDAPFTFVQITDYHMGDPRAERQFPGMDIAQVRIAALEAANRLNPSFVLITGDITAYTETYEWAYPAAVKEMLDHARVPLIIIPGNHDFYAYSDDNGVIQIDGRAIWPDFFGPTHTTLDFGPFRFICFNSYDWDSEPRNMNTAYQLKAGVTHTYGGTMSSAEFAWVRAAFDTIGDRTPVLVSHHGPRQFEPIPMQWCKDCLTQGKFMSLINKLEVPYYFYGHIHRNNVTKEKNTMAIATTSVGSDVDKNELWGIRVARASADRTITTEFIKLFDAPPMKK
ncbi:MAG: metallophosphoesterase [bacterium]